MYVSLYCVVILPPSLPAPYLPLSSSHSLSKKFPFSFTSLMPSYSFCTPLLICLFLLYHNPHPNLMTHAHIPIRPHTCILSNWISTYVYQVSLLEKLLCCWVLQHIVKLQTPSGGRWSHSLLVNLVFCCCYKSSSSQFMGHDTFEGVKQPFHRDLLRSLENRYLIMIHNSSKITATK